MILMVLGTLASAVALASDDAVYTEDFPIEACRFVPWGGNPYFRLRPGRVARYSNASCVAGGECEDLEEVRITVLPEIRKIRMRIDGRVSTIRTRVIEEFETENGELKETSRNFFATCLPSRDVYYFGEDVFDGDGQPMADAWLAGRNGARPGIIMPGGAFLLGSRYFQEVAPGVALDRAEHVGLGFEIESPAGGFDDCVRIEESTPLDPDSISDKSYCAGVGLVLDDELELVSIYDPYGRWSDDDDHHD